MRIAMIGSRGLGTGYGGIERMLDHLCPELVGLGHSIDVFSGMDSDFTDEPRLKAIRTPALKGKHLENISRSTVATLRSLRGYDLIHFHAIGPGILSLASKAFKRKTVVTIHGLDQRRDKWGNVARLCLGAAEYSLVHSADAITVVSDQLRQYFVERHNMPTAFIPNGQPDVPFRQPGALLASLGLQPGNYILFASRLTPEKGCHDLLRALNDSPPTMPLVVAGTAKDPAYMDQLRALADPARVRFAGFRQGDDLAELFTNAGLFVLPSYMEGMSMALLEAMSYGLPIVSSDIPENRAIAGNAATYFQPRNVASLQRALAQELAAPAGDRRPGDTKLLNWRSVAGIYDLLYRRISAEAEQCAFGLRPLEAL